MTSIHATRRLFAALVAFPLAAPSLSFAQTELDRTKTVELETFVVSQKGDQGYLAASSLSGSRLNTSMKDLAAPTTAFTADFLEDTAVRSIEELALYMPSTEINYPEANQAFFANDSAQLRIRGLPALNYSVNYFSTTLRLDTYNTGRVDQSRGANSILFGLGSPGGVVNISTNRAVVDRTFGSAKLQVRTNNGLRGSFDYNQELIHNRLAFRIDAVSDHGGTWRYHEYDHQDRVYLALRYKLDEKTLIDAQFERGSVNKSVGGPNTAADLYTIWAAAGKPLSTTANAALGIRSLGAASRVVVDTQTGVAMDWKNKMTTVANLIDSTQVYLTDFSLIPKRAAMATGPAFPQTTDYTRGSLFISRAFSRDFNVELAADMRNAPRETYNGASFNFLSGDPNATLPNGQPNPNAGRPYIEGSPIRNIYVDKAESIRLTAAYQHDFGNWFGKHQVAVLLENDWSKFGNLQMSLANLTNPYSLAAPENAANAINYRTYLDLAGDPNNIAAGDWSAINYSTLTESTTGRNIGARWINQAAGSALNRFNLRTAMGVLQSNFFKDRLVTVVGWRENWQDSYYSARGVRGPAFNGFAVGEYQVVPSSTSTPVRAHNETYSALFHVTDRLSLSYSWATDFALPSTTGSTPAGRVPPPTGRSQDFGVKFDLNNKIYLNATYFETSDTHDYLASTTLPTNPDTLINTIWSALGAAGVKAPDGSPAVNQQILSNGYTYDGVTKGYEFEIIANPTKNWRIYANYSDEKATFTNLGTESIAYFNQYKDFWTQGTNGRVLLDGSGNLAAVADDGSTVIDTVAKGVRTIASLQNSYYTLGNGQRPRGQMQRKANLRTNYQFTEGVLQGFSAGLGARYTSAPVTNFVQATSSTPVQIVFGKSRVLVDGNLGYKFKAKAFGRLLAWRTQLNVTNLFNDTDIVPLRTSITGQIITYRLQTPRQFIASASVEF